MMKIIPESWCRYTDRNLKDLSQVTWRLLIIKCNQISPLEYISAVDPGGIWFSKWTISHIGREYVISAMDACNALQFLGSHFMQFSNDQNSNGLDGLKYLAFLHVTSILGKLFSFSAGVRRCPIKLDEALQVPEGLSTLSFLKTLAFDGIAMPKMGVCSIIGSKLSLASTLYSIIKEFTSDYNILFNFLNDVLEHVKDVMKVTQDFFLIEMSRIIDQIMSNEIILNQIISSDTLVSIVTIGKDLMEQNNSVKPYAIQFLSHLFQSHYGYFELRKQGIFKLIANSGIETLQVSFTPLGVNSLFEMGDLCMSDVRKFSADEDNGLNVSQMSITSFGAQALTKSGAFGDVICNLWDLLDSVNDDEEISGGTLQVIRVLKLLISFEFVTCGLQYNECCESSRGSLDCLLKKLVLCDHSHKSDLYSYQEARYIGFLILKQMVSSLDIFITLQCRFRILEALRVVHASCFCWNTEGNRVFILDECSILINFLVLRCSGYGGPSEMNLASFDTLSEDTRCIFDESRPNSFFSVPQKNYLVRSEFPVAFEVLGDHLSSYNDIKALYLNVKRISVQFASKILRRCLKADIHQRITHRSHFAGQFMCKELEVGIALAASYIERILPKVNIDICSRDLRDLICVTYESFEAESFSGYYYLATSIFIISECKLCDSLQLMDALALSRPQLFALLSPSSFTTKLFATVHHWIELISISFTPQLSSVFTLQQCTPTIVIISLLSYVVNGCESASGMFLTFLKSFNLWSFARSSAQITPFIFV